MGFATPNSTVVANSAIEPEKWKQSITDFISRNLMTNIPHDEHKSQTNAAGREYSAHLLERLREELLTGDDNKDKSSSNMIGRTLLRCGNSRKHSIRKTFRSIKELKESGIHVKPNKTNKLKNDSTPIGGRFDGGYVHELEDVKVLRVAGMLHNYLGSDEEVADLFNKMSRDLVPDQDRYSGVVNDIHWFCNNPWTPVVAQVYYSHFSSPWTFLALLGVIISLLFSATQAYFSLPGNKPENE
ncbi:Tetratricopeptide repeat (TPR)-like superfamily protein [Hibiscus syriacus]|uniref:Tetratricopeptide repeat (TPR)-like superfamily protein n=1 Tax=Hibiscus syriacus TaxID=106335 RepID=A0A6A2YZD0_HIBSY|nr:Tetratricopeptide repeat (TPR)-like superfamily protein [Hibiscus syriacus]